MRLLSPEDWTAYQGILIALWTDSAHAYALYEPGELVAVALQEGAYPALPYPGADWFQRLAKDLNGHTAIGFQPTGTAIEQFRTPDGRAAWPEFIGPEGEGVHQVAVGPVYGEITEPAHFRFFVKGEQVLKLHIRSGYAHRGILARMRGKSPLQAAPYAARVTGDATVAHSLAFARAVEEALGVEVPERAQFLRGVMAELERLAHHCADLGEMAAIGGFACLESRFALLQEYVANTAQSLFGHRLMMDAVCPGGVARDMAQTGEDWLYGTLDVIESELPGLCRGFMDSASLQDRMAGEGVVTPHLAQAYNVGGYVGRGSGRREDARLRPGYPPYTAFDLTIQVEQEGDIMARIRVRVAEIFEAIRLIRQFLVALPDGPLAMVLPEALVERRMGLGVAESFRGPVWYWLKIENEQIQEAFMVDASASLWPVLEIIASTSSLAAFPLLERSLNPSCAGVDG